MGTAPLVEIIALRYGWHIEDRVLRRRVKASKHLSRLPQPGWSFDQDLYRQLRPRVDRLEVEDRESGLCYSIAAAAFDQNATKTDRGFGVQLYCALHHWTAEQRENTQLPLFAGVAT